jgi:hypothetical protein
LAVDQAMQVCFCGFELDLEAGFCESCHHVTRVC